LRTDSVTFWSWTASVALHMVILSAFGLWKLSEPNKALAAKPVPSATIAAVTELTTAAPLIPKPKVKSLAAEPAPGTINDFAVKNMFAAEPRDSQPETLILRTANTSTVTKPAALPSHSIEFFGSPTDRRKICYVVDSSGSMQGIFPQVQKKLKDSIADLRPNQYFYVIFFGNAALLESGQGRLVRASVKAKAAAYEFIDSIRPAGTTNAAAALQRALRLRDAAGDRPSVIYFLTDGFDLTTQRTDSFSRAITDMLKKEAPSTIINTIGFWPQPADRTMLEFIARSTGGQAILVTEDTR
jgi:Mg-chelatase subunit ChlD